jgi:hypothetical protein
MPNATDAKATTVVQSVLDFSTIRVPVDADRLRVENHDWSFL